MAPWRHAAATRWARTAGVAQGLPMSPSGGGYRGPGGGSSAAPRTSVERRRQRQLLCSAAACAPDLAQPAQPSGSPLASGLLTHDLWATCRTPTLVLDGGGLGGTTEVWEGGPPQVHETCAAYTQLLTHARCRGWGSSATSRQSEGQRSWGGCSWLGFRFSPVCAGAKWWGRSILYCTFGGPTLCVWQVQEAACASR